MDDNNEHVRRLAHLLTSANGRDFLKRIGYESGTPIMAADGTENLSDMLRQVDAAGAGQALIAVRLPERDEMVFLTVTREGDAALLQPQ